MLNGEKIIFRENGDILGIENYKDDILEGQFIRYFTDGRIKEAGEFKDGLEHGLWYYGSLNGDYTECLFINGKGKDGCRKWGPDDRDYWWWKIEYADGGNKEIHIEYEENPYNVWEITNIANGRLHGKNVKYGCLDKIIVLKVFDKGKLIEHYWDNENWNY